MAKGSKLVTRGVASGNLGVASGVLRKAARDRGAEKGGGMAKSGVSRSKTAMRGTTTEEVGRPLFTTPGLETDSRSSRKAVRPRGRRRRREGENCGRGPFRRRVQERCREDRGRRRERPGLGGVPHLVLVTDRLSHTGAELGPEVENGAEIEISSFAALVILPVLDPSTTSKAFVPAKTSSLKGSPF